MAINYAKRSISSNAEHIIRINEMSNDQEKFFNLFFKNVTAMDILIILNNLPDEILEETSLGDIFWGLGNKSKKFAKAFDKVWDEYFIKDTDSNADKE